MQSQCATMPQSIFFPQMMALERMFNSPGRVHSPNSNLSGACSPPNAWTPAQTQQDEVIFTPAALDELQCQQPQLLNWDFPQFLPGYARPCSGAKGVEAVKPAPNHDKGSKAVELARSVLNWNAEDLKGSSIGSHYWNPASYHAPGTDLKDNNCANFVSAVLKKAKLMKGNNKTNVSDLEKELLNQGWTVVQGQPKPGDVWISNERTHTELVSEVKNGQVKTIGANNGARRDGTVGQSVKERKKPEGTGFYLTPPTDTK